MKTILVPTDFSEHALYALKVAASIAKKTKGKIRLIHACNEPTATQDDLQSLHYYDRFHRELKTRAEEQIKRLSELDFLKGIEVEKHLISDHLLWEIKNDKWFKSADLIVVGSHGASGFSKAFIGSNTEKIVRIADSPVLTIKNEIDDYDCKSIVFASDFLKESYTSFQKIKYFADLYKVQIHLLKVITPKSFEPTPVTQKLMSDFVNKFNLKKYSINIYNCPSIETGIIGFSDEVDADLIAIETHGRTGFAHLINGSLAEDIVKHETKPVLSIKIKTPIEHEERLMGYRSGYSSWGNE